MRIDPARKTEKGKSTIMSRLKILVNAIPLTNIHTGIGRYLKCLYISMEEQYGHDVDIWYFDGQNISRKTPEGPSNRQTWSRYVDLFWKLPASVAILLRLVIHYRRELAFKKAIAGMNIYHEAGFFPFSSPAETKVVFTLHDLSIFRFPQYHPRERVLYNNLFLKRRCRNVDHFLTVSGFSKKEMIDLLNIPEEVITVTHLSHDETVFYPEPYDKERALFINGYRLPEKYFLFVGSGDPRKNLEIAATAIQKTDTQIPLVVVGWSGWLRRMQLPNIIQLGYLSDQALAQVYRRAVALVFPSVYEGFGLPVLEAMACGCPVITTHEASMPEVAGKSAVYMQNPQDVEELGTILESLAADQKLVEILKEMGKMQAGKFSWRSTASATFDAFQRVVGR
jgi:alpha-1,3-rhamnosyl/mannosyltransferase